MARFDVFEAQPREMGYWLDCQSDLLSHLTHRFVVPLIPRDVAPPQISLLNPVFTVEGDEVAMMTQYAATVPLRELGRKVGSLAMKHARIMTAIDTLVSDG